MRGYCLNAASVLALIKEAQKHDTDAVTVGVLRPDEPFPFQYVGVVQIPLRDLERAVAAQPLIEEDPSLRARMRKRADELRLAAQVYRNWKPGDADVLDGKAGEIERLLSWQPEDSA